MSETTRGGRHPIQFVCNGRTMPENQNRLSSVAYQYTAGVEEGKRRMSSAELRDLLAHLGVTDPALPPWRAELPNGVVVEALVPGTASTVAPPTKPAKRASKAPAAKKAGGPITAAKKAAKAAKKAPAKKATKATKATKHGGGAAPLGAAKRQEAAA